MFEDIKDFYPTPPKLIQKMIDKLDYIDFQKCTYILEPSAGSGSIIDYYKEYYMKRNNRYVRYNSKAEDYLTFDAIEIDERLASLLRGKGVNVVWDNFLTFEPQRFYQLVIMNPPFNGNEGCRHLLQAIRIQERIGGQILCILNSETLKNAYSNNRKELANLLSKYNADIEYIQDAFTESERYTEVETALIYINVPMVDNETMFERELKRDNPEIEFDSIKSLMPTMNKLETLIFECDMIKKSGIELFKEKMKIDNMLQGMNLKSKIQICDDYCKPNVLSVNSFVDKINLEYWQKFIEETDFKNRLPSKLRNNFTYNMEKQKNITFNLENVRYFYEELVNSIPKSYEETCSRIFDELTVKSAYTEKSWNQTVYLYSGWKTNSAYKIQDKSIIRFYNNGYMYRLPDVLTDLVIIFENLSGRKNTLDQKNENGTVYQRILDSIKRYEKNIDCPFMFIDSYKKGTLHLKYKDKSLVEAFNIIVGREKQWLPDDFGQKSYSDMTQEEKDLVMEFGLEIEEYDKLTLTNGNKKDYLRLTS